MNTNCQANMLLISASQRRFELQRAIKESLNLSVSVVATFQEALSAITTGHFTTVVLDESLMDLDPTQGDRFLNRCSDELPIFLRLAITGIPRSVRQVQLAIRRFDREQKKRAASVRHGWIRKCVTRLPQYFSTFSLR